MNTVLGVALIILNGGIHGALPVDSYKSVEACHEGGKQFLNKHPLLELPDGATIDYVCVDLSEYMQDDAPHVST